VPSPVWRSWNTVAAAEWSPAANCMAR